jgi:sugar lactone lactonase YvrE
MAKRKDVRVAVDVCCELGEGPIWHPERETLHWVDVYAQVLYESNANGGALRSFGFGERVSAAALIDNGSVAVTSAVGLYWVNLETGERSLFAPLEEDNPRTQTNDARAGPGGALWVGTWADDPIVEGMGSLYRYHAGKFERLQSGLTTPNSIAFSPDGTRAYFSDTWDHRILVYPLDPETGAPLSEPDLFLDLSGEGLYPDGSVVDAEGCLWNAQFGAGRLARYRPDGRFDQAVEFPVTMPTCPAFGGQDRKIMFVTSAWVGLSPAERKSQSLAGAVFAFDLDTPGLPEHRMKLPAAT